jgi:hypothetical protein
MFIGEDGKLSVYFNDEECEIAGFTSTIFQNLFVVKPK